MKRLFVLFSIVIAVAVFMDSCNSKKEKEEKKSEIEVVKQSSKPVVTESISLQEFLAQAIEEVKDNPVKLDVPANVKTSAKTVAIGSLKKEWFVSKIKPVLKKYPLTVVQKFGDGSQNLIYTYEQLELHDGNEVLTVIDPAPKYLAIVGGEIYLIKANGELWNERK